MNETTAENVTDAPASPAVRGLSSKEAAGLLAQYGPNELVEKQVSLLRRLLGYFWGPIPWMIEVAAVLSALVQHWADFWIIITLLVFNAGVGFWQEFTAGNAVAALKKQLALKARVLRDGRWQVVEARTLVPGDVVRLRLGDVIPADVQLIEGDYLSVDQSALTGESLPVSKRKGDEAFSSTIVKQGEVVARVKATGTHTRFGKTATLVEQAKTVYHFQKAVLTIGDYLIYISLALVALLVLVQFHRQAPWLEVVQFALILTVASIPVAMPAVLSMTMAMGAKALSRHKAIVTRLESIEEMASMDILCSDKTGTLTQNRLTLGEVERFRAETDQEVLLAAALASREENQDAIDEAVLNGLADKVSTCISHPTPTASDHPSDLTGCSPTSAVDYSEIRQAPKTPWPQNNASTPPPNRESSRPNPDTHQHPSPPPLPHAVKRGWQSASIALPRVWAARSSALHNGSHPA